QSRAILLRLVTSGTIRATGGAYENHSVSLWLFGADGLLWRWEMFDRDREAEALARFDVLTAAPPRPTRRVRPNAATASAARTDAAIVARDVDACNAQWSERVEYLHHPTGATWDHEGVLFSIRKLMAAERPQSRREP